MANHPFYSTPDWHRLRSKTTSRWKRLNLGCGLCRYPLDWHTSRAVHVDHIKPRATHPHLALAESNLWCLCAHCHNSVKKQIEANADRPTYGVDGWPV